MCYQLMQTAQPELFTLRFSRWDDLVDFDLVTVDLSDDARAFYAHYSVVSPVQGC